MDFSANTSTGSRLLTYEKAIDIGPFDGRRIVSGSVATRPRTPAASTRKAPAKPPAPAPKRDAAGVTRLTIVGLAMAIVGVVAIGYAAFQLYGTNVIAAGSQDDLAAEFAARVAAGVPEFDPNAVTPATSADPAEFEDQTDVPVLVGTIEPARPFPLEETDVIPWLYEGAPLHGAPLGRITIPRIDVDRIVVEGVGVPDLRRGPGHMPGTAIPGQIGNAVISGHRTTWGAPFNRLDELEPGDQIIVETLIGTHTYEVVSLKTVWPSEIWVATQWDGAWLTLTTCTPEFSSRHRLIVFAQLVEGPNAPSVVEYYTTTGVPPEWSA